MTEGKTPVSQPLTLWKLDPLSHSLESGPEPSETVKCTERWKEGAQRRFQHPWGPSFLLEATAGSFPSSPSSTCIILLTFPCLEHFRSFPLALLMEMHSLVWTATPSNCALHIPKGLSSTTPRRWHAEWTVGGVSQGHEGRKDAQPRGWWGHEGQMQTGRWAGSPRVEDQRVGNTAAASRASRCLLAPSLCSFLSAHPVSHEGWRSYCHTCLKQNPSVLDVKWNFLAKKNVYIFWLMNFRIIRILLVSFSLNPLGPKFK